MTFKTHKRLPVPQPPYTNQGVDPRRGQTQTTRPVMWVATNRSDFTDTRGWGTVGGRPKDNNVGRRRQTTTYENNVGYSREVQGIQRES